MEVKLHGAHRSRSIGATILPMQADPMLEWQRLAEHYRELSDDELRELAADFADLTSTAQEALRSEMRSRRLGDPVGAGNAPAPSNVPSAAPVAFGTSSSIHDPTVNPLIAFGRPPELVPDSPDAGHEIDGPVEYTWKTPLCDCDTLQEANELCAALKQTGIDSWIEGPKPSAYSAYASLGLMNPRVLVAADQLEQARAIAARPIPPEIVAESQAEVPEFVPPNCPKCGAPDPVLEGVDPVNSWKCEQCGQEWTDSVAEKLANEGPSSPGPA
jgi:hypothetical protein